MFKLLLLVLLSTIFVLIRRNKWPEMQPFNQLHTIYHFKKKELKKVSLAHVLEIGLLLRNRTRSVLEDEGELRSWLLSRPCKHMQNKRISVAEPAAADIV